MTTHLQARERIPLTVLLARTGTAERNFKEWKRRRWFPFEACQVPLNGKGSASDYPATAEPYLHLWNASRRKNPREPYKWLWDVWTDPADYPLDIRQTVVLPILGDIEGMLLSARNATRSIPLSGEASIFRKGGLARVAGRIRGTQSRHAILKWLVNYVLGVDQPSLFSATPQTMPEATFYELALKFGGLPRDAPILRGKVFERGGPYWIARFQRIIRLAQPREIERVRQYWRVIKRIAETVETVDWNKAPPIGLFGAKPEPPSWTARKARRSRPLPPPPIIDMFLFLWHDRCARIGFFCLLLIANRLFSRSPMPTLPDQWLNNIEQWLSGLPRKTLSSNARR
jgi:hypothetical protein